MPCRSDAVARRCTPRRGGVVHRVVFLLGVMLCALLLGGGKGVDSAKNTQHLPGMNRPPVSLPLFVAPAGTPRMRIPGESNKVVALPSWRFAGRQKMYEDFEPWYELPPYVGTKRASQARAQQRTAVVHSLATNTSERQDSVPLFGGITAVGEYYLQVKAGGQPVRIQLDSGSSTTAFPLSYCSSCRQGDKRYDPSKSTSAEGSRTIQCGSDECRANSCGGRCGSCDSATQACCSISNKGYCAFSLQYGDGSGCQGALVEDVLEWTPELKARTVFGGIEKDTSDFERSQVDGILGVAFPPLACNPTCIKPAFDALRDENNLRDEFTVCSTYDGGRLVLGAGDKSTVKDGKGFEYAPIIPQTNTFYKMQMHGEFFMDGHRIEESTLRVGIVDTGTTLLIISSSMFNKLVGWLKENKCDEFPGLCTSNTWFKPIECVEIDDSGLRALPVLSFDVGDGDEKVRISLSAFDYMLKYETNGQTYRCVGIHTMSPSGGVDVILGNTLQMKYSTHYDRVNKRIGFGTAADKCLFGKTSGGSGGSESSNTDSQNGATSTPKPQSSSNSDPKTNGDGEGNVVHGCETYAGSCADCSAAIGCTFNYVSHDCVNRHRHPVDSVLGWPWCAEHMYICEDRPVLRIGLIIGVVAGAAIFAMITVLGIVRCVRLRRIQASRNRYASGATDDAGSSSIPLAFADDSESDYDGED
ncbi:Cathepsin E [Porphyridium purpureum]|uniref:Cathepsin E n=1 Tax=Porphyridium purpureum TaxID=35688 RepID=A0A5J4Z1B5_PORPP|nr:Cathepsin E [Porphyridium purpureum]|eukprot:POR5403..scf208_2